MRFLAPFSRSRRRKEADSLVSRRSCCSPRGDEVEGFALLEASASSRRRLRPKRRCWGRRWLGFALHNVKLPEQLPVSFGHWVNVRVTGNDRAVVRPINLSFHQFTPNRICEGVKAKTGEGLAFSFLFAQNVIVWLMLPLPLAAQYWFQMCSQKLHGIQLIALSPQAHPDEMKVVGHQAVGWAEQLFASSRVKHEFTKLGVKDRCQPPAGTFLQRVRPKHNCVALVLVPFQSGKLPLSRWSHIADMELPPLNVKDVPPPCSRRANEVSSPVATDVKWMSVSANPPPHVGGYNAS